MFGHREQAGLHDQCAQAAADLSLAVPQVLGDGAAEGAAADHDDVEGPPALGFPALTSLMSLHR